MRVRHCRKCAGMGSVLDIVKTLEAPMDCLGNVLPTRDSFKTCDACGGTGHIVEED